MTEPAALITLVFCGLAITAISIAIPKDVGERELQSPALL